MTKPTTIPEDVEACADWSHPLPHPETGYVIKSTFPTAAPAPARRRIWCWQFIKPGEKYIDERSVNDGDIQHHRWHPECLEAMRAAARAAGARASACTTCRAVSAPTTCIEAQPPG